MIGERKTRKVAHTIYDLRVIGSVRIFVEAKKIKLLDNVGNELKGIRNKGYYIHDNIKDFISLP